MVGFRWDVVATTKMKMEVLGSSCMVVVHGRHGRAVGVGDCGVT